MLETYLSYRRTHRKALKTTQCRSEAQTGSVCAWEGVRAALAASCRAASRRSDL